MVKKSTREYLDEVFMPEVADDMQREFEYYNYLRYNHGWYDFFIKYHAYPACENSPSMVDPELEDKEDVLWQDFFGFMERLSNENYIKFANDASNWAERNLPD